MKSQFLNGINEIHLARLLCQLLEIQFKHIINEYILPYDLWQTSVSLRHDQTKSDKVR